MISIGVTSDLIKRVYEHKYADVPGLTQRYGCKHLVYYELTEDMTVAIAREKQQRWVVERSFAWLEKCRRLWKNCERKINTSLQMVVLAFLTLFLKRL